MTFVRRFTSDPGDEVIEQIEGIVLISRDPPAQISGAFAGTVMLLGEFEDGPFNVPTEIENGGDLLANFGAFGFTYGGLASCNPCARGRKADNVTSFEYWNGNAFVWLSQKKFGGLIVARVDTSVGAVEFTRLPAITGNNDDTWTLEDGQILGLDLAGAQSGATFSASEAQLTSAAGTYPTTFSGGESMNVTIDEGTDLAIGPIDIVFTVGDTSQALVIARINATLGYTAATDAGGGETTIAGRILGTGGSVVVNSVSVPLVTTATGFSPASGTGTGNVTNIAAVTLLEAKSVIEAAASDTRVDRDRDGNIRIAATSGASIQFLGISTLTAFGFVGDQVASEPSGFAVLVSAAGTYPDGFTGGETLSLGFDDSPNVVITFQSGDTARADVIARINAGVGFTAASANADAAKINLSGRVTGGQVRVLGGSTGVLTALGLGVITVTAVPHGFEQIPAGTRVRDDDAVEWVTMQTTSIDPDNAGPYSLKVRPGLDDGTIGSGTANTVTVLPESPGSSAWAVNNPSELSAALTEPAIDSAYDTALAATLAQSSVAKLANGVFAARQSNALRNGLRSNGLAASESGMTGRMSVIRPPLGTTRTVAKGGMSQPGVGRYRTANNVYAFPGLQIRIPQIAARGLSGGAGFTADGIVDVGADSLVATLMSQLAPEENIGQQTDIPTWALGLEKNNSDVQSMDINDYIAFKRAGIAAPVFDDGNCQIQSAVTTVDPTINPELEDIARQRFEYFLQDSIKQRLKAFNKKKMTVDRRANCLGEIKAFMEGLLSPSNPASARLDSYVIDGKSGNTKNSLARGQFRIILRCRMLPDMKFIVLETIVGTNVDTSVNVLAQAA
jgi:hypothetical protein